MKKYLESYSKGLLNGLGIITILGITGIAYGAYTSMTNVTSGQILTANLINQIQENIRVLRTDVDKSSPTGAVMAFNLSSCPSGWIAADGTSGTPDLRGEFVRGLDNGRGVDSGRSLNTWQAPSIITASIGPDAIQDLVIEGTTTNQASNTDFYTGTQTDPISDSWYATTLKGNIWIYGTNGYTGNSAGRTVDSNMNRTLNNSSFAKAGGSRPRNVSLLYCVKQ